MRFLPTIFEDAWLLDPERHEDQRGFFARTWCQREFEQHGLNSALVQCSVSFNHAAGTLRGMHYQDAPFQEAKLVRCTQGSIFDVIVDVRERSRSFGLWQGFELSAKNGMSLYIPEGFAHGFQTLEDESEVHYQMTEFFHAGAAQGFHYADPGVGIEWPLPVAALSENDKQRPALARGTAVTGSRT